MVVDLNQRTYFLITGASKGIGRTMAIAIAQKLAAESVIVLIARSGDGLAKTKATIKECTEGKTLHVLTYVIDLAMATAVDFACMLNDSLRCSKTGNASVSTVLNFQRAFIMHNAGTVGDVTKRAIDVSDVDIWSKYYHMNLFSVISLTSEFYRTFAGVPKLVVNVSSKCGIEPFSSMSFYCSAKAARDMYFRVLATEEPSTESLVLNYAPGAIDTAMSLQLQEQTINQELAKQFKQQRDTKTMLTPEQTAQKLIQILQEKKFTSGDHVDYWD